MPVFRLYDPELEQWVPAVVGQKGEVGDTGVVAAVAPVTYDAESKTVGLDADTDDIVEGDTNLYYTDGRVQSLLSFYTSADFPEGTTNLYYTDERAASAAIGLILALGG